MSPSDVQGVRHFQNLDVRLVQANRHLLAYGFRATLFALHPSWRRVFPLARLSSAPILHRLSRLAFRDACRFLDAHHLVACDFQAILAFPRRSSRRVWLLFQLSFPRLALVFCAFH